jgi:NAD-reducing hydrogenase small subunit
MGLLNLHGGLLELFERCDLVYSPLADIKQFPYGVDICLVEGAVGNGDNREMAMVIRERSSVVVSLGDCAVNGNVAALRNPHGMAATLGCVYPGLVGQATGFTPDVPVLLEIVLPLHQVIAVDAFIPGCPPEPETIRQALERHLGRIQSNSPVDR